MFLSRVLAGLLVILPAVVVCGQESKATTPPDRAVKELAPAAKDPGPESERPVPPPLPVDKLGDDKPSPEQLREWIKNLAHQRFATRQAASQKLVQAGVPGMEAAAEAAKTEDLELATRCLAVLTEGLSSKTEAVRIAAKTALEALAKSDNKSVAHRAGLALDTPRGIPGIPGIARPGNGRNFQQIRVQVVNGAREITIIENGREVVCKDNNGKDITVTVTETVNGKPQTQTFKAKDEDDLKKNHPDAHAYYAKYGKGNINGGIQIQIGGNAFGGRGFLPPVPQLARRRILNPIKAAGLFEEIDKLRERLEESNARLSKAAGSDKPDPAELKKISDEINTATKRLAEISTEAQLP